MRDPDFTLGIRGGKLINSGVHPHYVYVIRDQVGGALYVGMTDRPVGRMDGHRKERLWWEQADHVDYFAYPNRLLAAQAEWQLIRQLRPPGNVAGNGGSANVA